MAKLADIVISVVAPIHNDSVLLKGWIQDVSTHLSARFQYYELILVDDGSTDETANVVSQLLSSFPSVRYIELSRNFGFDTAASAGIETAVGDYVVITSLRNDPPEVLPDVIEKCRTGHGITIGVSQTRARENMLRSALKKGFHWYAQSYLGLDLTPGATALKCLDRGAINAITRIRDQQRRLRVMVAMVTRRQDLFYYTPVPSARDVRHSIWHDISQATDFAIATSMHPLRMASRVALIAAAINFVYMFYVVAVYLFKTDVTPGWATLSLQHATMFLFIFIMLVTLSEYIGRILEETRDRPSYFIRNEKSSAVQIRDPHRLNVEREI